MGLGLSTLSLAGTSDTPSQAAGVDFRRTDIPSTGDPVGVAVGDFNGDGRPDAAVAHFSSATVSILVGNATGGLAFAGEFAVGANPLSVAVGDINGDGNVDLAVASYGSDSVSLLVGSGTGTFTWGGHVLVGGIPSSVAAGDFNGDGKVDLVTANLGSNSVSVLYGNGAGAFTRLDHPVGMQPRMAVIADFNLDGNADIAVANYGGASTTIGTVTVLLGDGGVVFTRSDFVVAPEPRSIAHGDVDGDGRPDFVTGNYGSATASVMVNNGAGGFTRSDVAVGRGPRAVAIADFNGDGKADLAVANETDSTVSVLLGNGAGSFSRSDVAVSTGPYFITPGDFDRDDRADLIVTSSGSDAVSLLSNNDASAPTPPTCAVRRVVPGPPERTVMGLSDLRSGLSRVEVIEAVNANVHVSPFAPYGAFSEVEVVATKVDQTKSLRVSVRITDGAGNVTTCSNSPGSPSTTSTTSTTPTTSAPSTTSTTSAPSTTSTTVGNSTTTTTAPAPPGGTPFVTSFTPTHIRNDFSGWLGSVVRVGSSNLEVTALGRAVVSGNSANHTVKLVDASTGKDVAGGSVSVATAGASPNTFRYANLATPVTLRANTTYYVITRETAGGDAWYDYDTKLVTTAAAADTGVVYSMVATPTIFVTGDSPNNGYGPTNFLYR